MKTLLTFAIVLFACLRGGSAALGQKTTPSVSASTAPQAGLNYSPLTDEQKGWLRHANRHEKHGWIYLHIEGEPRKRGFQHGYLLADEIRDEIRLTKIIWNYHTGMDWPWLVKKAKTVLGPKVDPEDRDEMDGIVEGLRAAGVNSSLEEVITLNAIIELEDYWWPGEKKKLSKTDSKQDPHEACSSFIATGGMTKDGGVVLGHNTMGGYLDPFSNVILDIQPAKGHRILMQTTAGWIHSGTDFFITDAGLVGSETTISNFEEFDAKKIPEFVRMRRAMQDASSLDEWCKIMKKGNNGGYANAWLIGDVNTKEIARLEMGLKYVRLEKKTDGYFVGSNVAEDLKILRLETTARETDIRESDVTRRVRWKQLMKQYAGQIDLDRAKAFEADHFDTFLQKESPGYRTLCMHNDLDVLTTAEGTPFKPAGTFDAKVVDTQMARRMSFAARWGSACGAAFDAEKFLDAHPQFDWMRGNLKSRPSQPWTEFTAGERE